MHQCPIVEDYMFQDHCDVTSCKNHTFRTEDRCISLNCEDSEGIKVSDSEIQYFKQIKTLSAVVAMRKKAEDRVWKVLVLDGFFNFCTDSRFVDVRYPAIAEWMGTWPMSTGMWPNVGTKLANLVDKKMFLRYKEKLTSKVLFEQHEILGVDKEGLTRLRNAVKDSLDSCGGTTGFETIDA